MIVNCPIAHFGGELPFPPVPQRWRPAPDAEGCPKHGWALHSVTATYALRFFMLVSRFGFLCLGCFWVLVFFCFGEAFLPFFFPLAPGQREVDRTLLCLTHFVTRDHPRKSPTAVGSTAGAPGACKRIVAIGFKKTTFPSSGAINNSDLLPKWFGKPACLPGAGTEGSLRASSRPSRAGAAASPRHCRLARRGMAPEPPQGF